MDCSSSVMSVLHARHKQFDARNGHHRQHCQDDEVPYRQKRLASDRRTAGSGCAPHRPALVELRRLPARRDRGRHFHGASWACQAGCGGRHDEVRPAWLGGGSQVSPVTGSDGVGLGLAARAAVALFVGGAMVGRLTNRLLVLSVLRQLALGAAAATVTFGIGSGDRRVHAMTRMAKSRRRRSGGGGTYGPKRHRTPAVRLLSWSWPRAPARGVGPGRRRRPVARGGALAAGSGLDGLSSDDVAERLASSGRTRSLRTGCVPGGAVPPDPEPDPGPPARRGAGLGADRWRHERGDHRGDRRAQRRSGLLQRVPGGGGDGRPPRQDPPGGRGRAGRTVSAGSR